MKKKSRMEKDKRKKGREKLPETIEGSVVYTVPFPGDLSDLKGMTPIVLRQRYSIDYVHSYGQDSPFFAGLSNGKLLGTRCPVCGHSYATPRFHCMGCGNECEWFALPLEGRIHTFTTCYYGSESFLSETPFHLVLVEFEGVDTLFLSRLIGVEGPEEISIGMKVRAKFRRLSKMDPTDVYFIPG